LLDVYGSLGRVFAASPTALRRLLGDQATADRIAAARDAVLAGIKEDVARQAFDLHDQAIQRYIVGLFNGLTVERLHAVFLCGRGTYLADECLSEGSVARLVGNLRLIVTRAIDLGAVGIVLIHNHPSGQLSPSRSDIEGTHRLDRSLAELDLSLVDHLIVAGTAILSMRGANLL
jgi:DNA repair protein RadC